MVWQPASASAHIDKVINRRCMAKTRVKVQCIIVLHKSVAMLT